MNALKRQYLLMFAVMGSIMPYVSVYLAEGRGLADWQVGYVMSVIGLAVLLTPALVTLLADAWLENRTLLVVMFAVSAAALLWLLAAQSFIMLLAANALYALAFWPLLSVQDGLYFRVQRRRADEDQPPVRYHRVRVYGTIGFIVPSLLLYVLLDRGLAISVILISGISFAVLGALNAATLPKVRDSAQFDVERARLPTLAAARAMIEPHVLVFCIGMWLLYFASATYFTFFPLYLTDPADGLGIASKWVGLIANIGVVIEIFFMLAFGRLLGWLGLRGLLILGTLGIVLRYAVLGLWPSVEAAVGVQFVHGVAVLAMHVIPPLYLNQRADDAYRTSMQGVYMMIMGTARVAGSIAAGYIAEWSLQGLFLVAAALSLIAMVLFVLAFKDRQTRIEL